MFFSELSTDRYRLSKMWLYKTRQVIFQHFLKADHFEIFQEVMEQEGVATVSC